MIHAESFIFESYEFSSKDRTIRLRYSLDGNTQFEEVLTLPADREIVNAPSSNALFLLHLAGGVSYYKTCLPKAIVLRSGELNAAQAEFWNTVYEKGLGEFFYQNEIDFRDLIHFPVSDTAHTSPKTNTSPLQKTLVPIGGGKDSIVTIEMLRKEGKDITLFRMGDHPLIQKLVAETGLPCITVKRALPASLFRLNEEGALNGHVPISAYLSALCVVLAEIYGFTEIAMSNEKSANYGNVEYLGTEINHQWSKSEEFEHLFQTYLTEFVNADLQYFSALRSMNELQIAEIFTDYPQYYLLFTSCNNNWKIAGDPSAKRWCGTCPKCAFSFCMFASFLPLSTLLQIFGENLYAKEELIPLYKELLGREGTKPFECVGTPEEVTEAFTLAHKRGELEDTVIMQMFLHS